MFSRKSSGAAGIEPWTSLSRRTISANHYHTTTKAHENEKSRVKIIWLGLTLPAGGLLFGGTLKILVNIRGIT